MNVSFGIRMPQIIKQVKQEAQELKQKVLDQQQAQYPQGGANAG